MHSMAGPTSQPRPVPWLIIPSLLLLWSCAAPVQGLWPPPEGAPTRTIVVSLDTWHAMIAITLDERVTALDQKSMFEEWGYAEQAWYLEGRQGITGALRALFRPNPGVVEIGLHEQVWPRDLPNRRPRRSSSASAKLATCDCAATCSRPSGRPIPSWSSTGSGFTRRSAPTTCFTSATSTQPRPFGQPACRSQPGGPSAGRASLCSSGGPPAWPTKRRPAVRRPVSDGEHVQR